MAIPLTRETKRGIISVLRYVYGNSSWTYRRPLGYQKIPEHMTLRKFRRLEAWDQLSEDDLEMVNMIANRYLGECNYVKAYKDGILSQDAYDLIQRFSDWNDSLGGYDD